MKNHVKIIIFSIFVLFLVILAGFGLSKVKVDDFHKAAVIFVVDSSASNIKDLPAQTRVLKQLCSMLDPEDHIKILRVSEKSYIIYEGSPQSSSEIRKSMDKFTKFDEKEYGTAYGLSLKKAFSHAQNLYNDGYVPAVVVIGDLENEGAIEKQINWDTLPENVKKVQEYIPEISMMFVYAHPEKLDMVKTKLNPILGEKKLLVANETGLDKINRRFLEAIGR
jgi:hypothetical protein